MLLLPALFVLVLGYTIASFLRDIEDASFAHKRTVPFIIAVCGWAIWRVVQTILFIVGALLLFAVHYG